MPFIFCQRQQKVSGGQASGRDTSAKSSTLIVKIIEFTPGEMSMNGGGKRRRTSFRVVLSAATTPLGTAIDYLILRRR
jgi:hypothetical protein